VEDGTAELADAADRLRSALAQLTTADPPAPERCGASCVCDDAMQRPVEQATVELAGAPDRCGCDGTVAAPISCTLDAAAIDDRVRDWHAVVRLAAEVERAPGRRSLTFAAEPALIERLAMLASAEVSCCSFLQLSVHFHPGTVVLQAAARPEADDVLAALFG